MPEHYLTKGWLLGILLSVVGAVGLGMASFFVLDRADILSQQATHEALPGHPVMVERMAKTQEDLGEIKSELQTQSGKLGDISTRQEVIGDRVERILEKVEGL